MVKPIEYPDHVDAAVKNFLNQYRDSTKFNSFVNSFLKELNDLETDFQAFKEELPLATAIGKNLDKWGVILQANQRPVDDETFRVLLYALVGAYYSEGRPQDLLSILKNTVEADAYSFQDFGQGIFGMTVYNPNFTFDESLTTSLIDLGKPAGTEFLGVSSSIDNYFAFTIDTDPDADGFSVIGGDDGGFYTVLIV